MLPVLSLLLAETRNGSEVVLLLTQVVVKVFGLHGPVLPHGVFDAATERPTDTKSRPPWW